MNVIKHHEGEARLAGQTSLPAWDGKQPLPLADRWALSTDQWLLLRAKNVGNSIKWQPVGFVGSQTAVLSRILQDNGIDLPDGALEATLNGAVSFLEWRELVRRHRTERLDRRTGGQIV